MRRRGIIGSGGKGNEPDYLNFTSNSDDSTIKLTTTSTSYYLPSVEYSYDKETWESFIWTNAETNAITVNQYETVWMRGTNNTISSGVVKTSNNNGFTSNSQVKFVMTGAFFSDGNIMSLLDPTCKQTTVPVTCFHSLFMNCLSLLTPPYFPAVTGGAGCYYQTFYNSGVIRMPKCISLTTIPQGGMGNMFYGCANLTNTDMEQEFCYTKLNKRSMYRTFSECSSITETPWLPDAAKVQSCYDQLFYNCVALKTFRTHWTSGVAARTSSSTFSTDYCARNWDYGITAPIRLYCAISMDSSTDLETRYAFWESFPNVSGTKNYSLDVSYPGI